MFKALFNRLRNKSSVGNGVEEAGPVSPNLLAISPREQEEDKDSKTLNAVYSWVILLLGVAALPVTRLPYFELSHPDVRLFIEELAFAMILAGLFSLTVEKYHREEFRKFVIDERDKLKRNVFLYAYGHNVSQQTREEIRDLLECPFHRDELRLSWHFASVAGTPEKVRLTKRVTYVQRNGTMQAKPYKYSFHYNFAALEPGDEAPVQQVKIRRKGEPDISLPGEDGTMETEGIVLAPGQGIEVSITLTEQRLTTGEDSYSSRHPLIGKTLVEASSEGDVNLQIEGFCKGRDLAERSDHAPLAGLWGWQLEEGLLPFQSIVISWSRRHPAAGANAAAPPTAGALPTEVVTTTVARTPDADKRADAGNLKPGPAQAQDLEPKHVADAKPELKGAAQASGPATEETAGAIKPGGNTLPGADKIPEAKNESGKK
jgi:hypothetical protein